MSKDADDHVRVMTTGSSSPILPQVFFRFRGSYLLTTQHPRCVLLTDPFSRLASNVYLTTTPDSNATVDVTVSSDSIMRKCTFDSAEGLMGITDLPDNSTMLLTLTVNPATTTATLFGLTSVKITTPPDAYASLLPPPLPRQTLLTSLSLSRFRIISSVLPPPTTPSPAISPTSSTPQTPNPSTNTSDSQVLKHQIIILALAITLGVGLGLPLLVVGGYLFLRWRRKRLRRKLAERWSFVLI